MLTPLFFEYHEIFYGFIFGNGAVGLFQIGHQQLDVLITHRVDGETNLMDGAPLHLALEIERTDGLHELLLDVYAKQIDI